MSMRMNRGGYSTVIEADIEDVEKHIPESIFRDHIIKVLRESVKLLYDEIPEGKRRWVDTYGPDNS